MITRFLNKISSNHLLPSLGRGMGVGLMAFCSLFAATSCEDMLMTENDSMVIDPDMGSMTDSVFYALGIAQAMQQVADQYFFVGEMRGELVSTTTHTDNNLRQLADYSATTTNKYDSAYVYYKVINNCNYYLAHRDTSLYIGSTNVSINEYAAVEAWRAWAYLQLARTYGGNELGVPFYTEPLTAISQINEDNFPKKTLTEIVAELAPSLEKYSGLPVPTMGNTSLGVGSTNWGTPKNINMQMLYVPVDVILGEMYLEDGQWLKAAQHYCKYLCDNKLVAQEWTGGRRNFGAGYDMAPEDYANMYNQVSMSYHNIFSNLASPADVVSYIPMAVSSQRGKTTDVPLAFGYDYYSTDRSGNCPRVDEIQIVPSATYFALTDSCAYYYYPYSFKGSTVQSNPDTVKVWRNGDARANYQIGESAYLRDQCILNRDMTDTTKIYIGKAHKNANIYLFRETTLWLHLAEAFNRLGYPELSFAILRNGISTYLEELVPGAGDVYGKHQYLTAEAISLITNQVPFLNAENRNVFVPEETYGIHHHGGGTRNGVRIENNSGVVGSRATAVGSERNHHYLPSVIIGEKMAEIAQTFGVAVSAEKQDSINAMEDILCDEYAKEFAFEGVRFYDLQRMARHKNEAGLYGGDFGSRWFAEKLKDNNPTKSLLDAKNWYLPFK